jgi:hypothetical protein
MSVQKSRGSPEFAVQCLLQVRAEAAFAAVIAADRQRNARRAGAVASGQGLHIRRGGPSGGLGLTANVGI